MNFILAEIMLKVSAQEGNMTKDQIDELMRENGIVVVGEAVYILCNLVEAESAATEREACAKRLDAIGCDHCATNIRLRGQ